MRIVVCDDSLVISEQLSAYSRKLATTLGLGVDITVFGDGAELIERYDGADLMFVDVEMPLLDGIEACREIRRHDDVVAIVFVTSFERYAVEGYRVSACRYLVKPVDYETFAAELGDMFVRIGESLCPCFEFSSQSGLYRVRPRDVSYVETAGNHKLLVAFEDGTVAEGRKTIEEAAIQLGQSFFRCHRSYLVNMAAVARVSERDISLRNGVVVPLSKHRKKDFMTAFLQYRADVTLSSTAWS